MSIESLQEQKLELEIEAQKRALLQPPFNEWKKPSAVIPSVIALIGILGLVIQSINTSYATKIAEIDRKTHELKVEQLKSEITAKTLQSDELNRQIALARADNQKLNDQHKSLLAGVEALKKEVQGIADRRNERELLEKQIAQLEQAGETTSPKYRQAVEKLAALQQSGQPTASEYMGVLLVVSQIVAALVEDPEKRPQPIDAVPTQSTK